MALGRVFSISYGSSTCLKPLAECTPAEIQEIISDGNAQKAWQVGDIAKGVLTTGYGAYIIGFDHNKNIETAGKKSVHFAMTITGNKYVAFTGNAAYDSTIYVAPYNHHKQGDSGIYSGWEYSKIRETLFTPSTLGITSAWQDIISPVTKYTDNSPTNLDSETGVTATTDLMWLPSEFEVFGAITNSNPSEEFFQQQYDFFKNKAVSRVRYDFFNNKKAVKWWLRSPQFTLRYCFCAVSTSGTVTTQNANLNLGVVICFAVVG